MQKANASSTSGREGFLAKTGSLFSTKFTSSLNQHPWPTRSVASRGASRQTSPQRVPNSPSQSGPPDFSADRESTSSRSSRRTHKSRATSLSTTSLTYSPEKKSTSYNPLKHYPSFSTSFPSRRASLSRQSSYDSFGPPIYNATTAPSPLSAESPYKEAPLPTMLAAPLPNTTRKDPEYAKSPNTTQSTNYPGQGANGVPLPGSNLPSAPPVGGLQNPSVVYQNIHETSSKRISTLDYLRKA